MKVAFLIFNMSSGGAERVVSSLCNYFSGHGIEPVIITMFGNDSFYKLNPGVKLLSVENDSSQGNNIFHRILTGNKRIVKLRRIVKAERPDFVVGMSYSMVWYAVLACAFTCIKAVGTERNNPYKYEATFLNSLLRKLFYRLSDAYVFQTKKSSEFFTKRLRKNDVIIPNAIFNEMVYELRPPEKREKVICAVGRLTQQKRFDILLKAFSLINDKIPEYKLVIFGKGELEKNLKDICVELEIQDKVIFAGTSPLAVKAVNLSSCFVLSSEMEGMPNALIEALAMGVPSVSTRCDMGPEELINDGENGLLVPVNDPASLADAVIKVLTDDTLANNLSRNARKLLNSNSIDTISNTWIDFLTSLL